LSARYGARIWLKREDLSPVRSYKIRGAFNFIRKALKCNPDQALFVCASAGNHAQGFAFVCRHFGRKGVVFMPVTTPQQKIDKTRMFGGEFIEIRLTGDFFDACYASALEFAQSEGALMAPPFDHDDIIEGQATVAAEIKAQLPENENPDLIVLPVGGGGLSAGVSRYLEGQVAMLQLFCLSEPDGAPSLKQSLSEGRRVKLGQDRQFRGWRGGGRNRRAELRDPHSALGLIRCCWCPKTPFA
jgi:threonine dehydratase